MEVFLEQERQEEDQGRTLTFLHWLDQTLQLRTISRQYSLVEMRFVGILSVISRCFQKPRIGRISVRWRPCSLPPADQYCVPKKNMLRSLNCCKLSCIHAIVLSPFVLSLWVYVSTLLSRLFPSSRSYGLSIKVVGFFASCYNFHVLIWKVMERKISSDKTSLPLFFVS